MTYLSRLILNPRGPSVRRGLADCHELHRTILSAFPSVRGDARQEFGVLYRLEQPPRDGGALVLLVQSRERPDWSRLPPDFLRAEDGERDNPAMRPLDDAYGSLEAGRVLRFRLRANPTKKINTKSSPEGERRNGQRVPLIGEEARLAWLARKASEAGFRLLAVQGRPETPAVDAGHGQKQTGWRPTANGKVAPLTFEAVRFDGSLVVTDADRFRSALASGIGSGKAYGFGLLSIASGG